MVFGMVDVDGDVPGTVYLDSSNNDFAMPDMKRVKGKDHIMLSPQPSDDPDEPLNWPAWRKNLVLVTISIVASLTNAIGPMVSTAFLQIAKEYNISIDAATSATGGSFSLAMGFSTFFTTAAAVKWGKRPLFVISTFLLIFFNVWALFAGSIMSLAASRALSGLAAAPFETLVSSSIADLFFVHERGQKLAIYGLSVGAGLAISQVGGGAVVQYLGWKKLFLITAACFAVMFVLVLFVVPETAYRQALSKDPLHDVIEKREVAIQSEQIMFAQQTAARAEQAQAQAEQTTNRSSLTSSVYSSVPPPLPHTSILQSSSTSINTAHLQQIEPMPMESAYQLRKNTMLFLADRLSHIPESPTASIHRPRKTHWQLLTFVPRQIYSEVPLLKLAFRPVPLFIYPAVLFTSLVNGLNFTFLLAFGLASLSLFAAEPYHLQPLGIGLTAIPAVVAASLGQPLAGWSTDYIARRMTRTNDGIYEPEMRLLSMIPSTFFATIGFIGFGTSIHGQQVARGGSIFIPLAWYALIAFSVPWTNVAAFSYLIDSHSEVANEAFVTTHFTKGIMILAVASTLNGFLAKYGALNVFLVIAMVNFVASCFTLVFWRWGKCMRHWVSQSHVLGKI